MLKIKTHFWSVYTKTITPLLVLVAVGVWYIFKTSKWSFVTGSSKEQLIEWYPSLGRYLFTFIPYLDLVWGICLMLAIPGALWFLLQFTNYTTSVAKQKISGREKLYAVGLVVITLLAAECALRTAGYEPRKFRYQNDMEVDSLYELKGVTTDEEGILKISEAAARHTSRVIQEAIKANHQGILIDTITAFGMEYNIASNYYDVISGRCKNEFADTFRKTTTLQKKTLQQQALVNYVYSPINKDGFRSIPFQKIASAKPSVLMLGDSYTWGHNSANKSSSFADILLARGYPVYNSGIGATDPPQYLAIAKKYVPLLKPDILVVNFYLGNDVQYFNRVVSKDTPLLWMTNSGTFLSCEKGVYFKNMREPYEMYIRSSYIPTTTAINRFLSKTVLGTLVWRVLPHIPGITTAFQPEYNAWQQKLASVQYAETPYSNAQMEEIKEICRVNGTVFVLVAIKGIEFMDGNIEEKKVRDFPHLFENTRCFEPDIPLQNYTTNNPHFNDTGHAWYAGYLQHVIDSVWLANKP